MRHRLPQT